MVDFNNSTIVGKSRTDIVNIIIIQRWADAIDAIRLYYERKARNKEKGMVEFQTEMASLFYQIQEIIQIEAEKEREGIYPNHKFILADIESGEEERVFKAWDYMAKLLYVKGITKIDKKELYDRSDIFAENQMVLGGNNNGY
jgi:hypothetical protein